jgi:hypothetical protein
MMMVALQLASLLMPVALLIVKMSIGITGATAELWGHNAESTANKGS